MPEEPDLLIAMREVTCTEASKADGPLLAALREQFKNDPVKFIGRLEAMENNWLISQGKQVGQEEGELDPGTKRAVEHAEKLLAAIKEEVDAARDQGGV